MRRFFIISMLVSLCAALSWSQTAPASKAAPVKKPATTTATPAKPTAVIDTTEGALKCDLFPDKAPIGVANFVGLARGTKAWTDPVTGKKVIGKPLYNGTIFHRVIPSFMIQGGDPKGDGTGDPGYKFKNETSPDLGFDQPGRLAYANAGPDTNGSQFFVTEVPYPSLNGGYTIFGQCDEPSVELVKKIARESRDSNDRPYVPVKINKITITGIPNPAAHKAATKTGTASKKPATAPKAQ
ncbi:MAG TPA: peptidylprolyl isomerase [Terriglobales bacterium]|nr:peptidylprolyl isomerase [Terriglobales bacterium]